MFWTDQAPVLVLWAMGFLAASWLPPRSLQVPAQTVVGLGLIAWISPVACAVVIVMGIWSGRVSWRTEYAWLTTGEAHPADRFYLAHLMRRGERAIYKLLVLVAFLGLGTGPGSALGTWLGTAGFGFAACRLWSLVKVPAAAAGPLARLHFLSFLPLLVAGPLEPFESFRRAESRRRWSGEDCSDGLERILLGLVQAQVLGAWLVGLRLTYLLQWWPPGLTTQLLGALQPGLLLYCQFAGASSVALGLARCAGFEGLQENFRFPLLARDPVDFWTRWHRTLAVWCREEVFDPVLARTRNPWLASVASMVVMGLWHAGTVPYVIWGLVQGLLIAGTHAVRRRWPARPGGPMAVCLSVTAVIVMLLSFRIAAAPSLAALVGPLSRWLLP